MRNTFLIQKGRFWDLARHLKSTYGAPSVNENLTIYIDNSEAPHYLKIALTSEELKWQWFQRSEWEHGTKAIHDKRRPYKTITTTLNNLKAKLVFLANIFGNEGELSTTIVYCFTDVNTQFKIDIRPNTLVGEIVAIQSPNRSVVDDSDVVQIKKYENEIKEFIVEGLYSEIDKERPLTKYVRRIGEESWTLDPIVMEFCQRNGIGNAFTENPSKQDMLEERSNDYAFIEKYFYELTGVELLTQDRHYVGDISLEANVSIIIPCFNAGESIQKVLLGIESQHISDELKKNLEVIIVDDASIESVSNFIETKVLSFTVHVISLSHNSGAAHARQIGMSHSKGEILIFLDSDIILSKHYLADHIIRNQIITNCVLVSFKEDIDNDSPRVSEEAICKGLPEADYSKESRTRRPGAIIDSGNYDIKRDVNLLEETNFFKNFHGSRRMAMRKLSSMVIGHNFSLRKSLLERARPFSRRFKGWGWEDEYHGIQLLLAGAYFIPVLSSSVYHINHPPRSGSEDQKKAEEARNQQIIQEVLQEPAAFHY